MKNDPYVYLGHILDCIEAIAGYLTGKSLSDFMGDQMLQDAVIRRLEIIGEAVKQMPSDFKASHPETPWRDIGDTRNKLIHEYFGVDFVLAWKIFQNDLPVLKEHIQQILDSVKTDNS